MLDELNAMLPPTLAAVILYILGSAFCLDRFLAKAAEAPHAIRAMWVCVFLIWLGALAFLSFSAGFIAGTISGITGAW